MKRELIATSAGKLGDFIYTLPVASWLYRKRGVRVHWCLPTSFGPFNYIENLLLAQPSTARVSLVPFQVTDFNCGGQPYRWDPRPFLPENYRDAEYVNLGFRHYPDKFLPAFYAEEHGFGYDADFRLNIGSEYLRSAGHLRARVQGPGSDPVFWHKFRSIEGAMARIVPDAEPLPAACDLLDLALIMNDAAEIHSWFCGIAVLCWFADIPVHVYRVPGHASKELYFPEDRGIVWHELAGIPEAVSA